MLKAFLAFLALQAFAAVGFAEVAGTVPAEVATHPAAAPQRSLELRGAPNFRDIGGYATGDGRHLRWGRVFRSSELSKLTPADAERVDKLDIMAVIDLRTEGERRQSPSIWLRRPQDVYESPKPSLAPVMQKLLREAQTADGARAGIEGFYADMPDSYSAEYAALFHRIAAGELPILVHCSAGKDRTGVAVAVLMSAIGVPRDAVLADYALTEELVPMLPSAGRSAAPVGAATQATSVLGQLPEESQRVLWRSDPNYLTVALESIDREYGSIDAYVRRGLGVSARDLDTIRAALTE